MGRIPNDRDIEREIKRRRWEENNEYLRLLCENTPEAKARVAELDEKHRREDEEKKKALDNAIAMRNIAEAKESETYNKVVDNILNGRVLQRFGDYRTMFFYRKSKVIYDLTFHFCDRFITEYHDRTKDQMIQAARSGKQNFVEGLQDGQANFEMALNLVSIGQGSLQELREDYEDYIRTRNLTMWTKGHRRYDAMVNFCKSNNDIETYAPLFPKMNDEELSNLALTLIHQTDFLIEGFLKKMEADFIASGGTKEHYQRLRRIARGEGHKGNRRY